MVNLPYDFDTAATWQRIVQIIAAIVGAIALSIVGAAATGQWRAAAAFAMCGAIFALLLRIARRVPLGAAGTITASELVARPVTQFGLPLRVPVGRFPITHFRTVELQRTIVVIRPAGSRNNEDIGSVFLVGPDGSPRIEVVRTSMSAATIAARDLSTQLGLHLREAAAPPPGERVAHVQLGA